MRILFADQARARRELIDSRALKDDPFLSRLWYHHLFWIQQDLRPNLQLAALHHGQVVLADTYARAEIRLCHIEAARTSRIRLPTPLQPTLSCASRDFLIDGISRCFATSGSLISNKPARTSRAIRSWATCLI